MASGSPVSQALIAQVTTAVAPHRQTDQDGPRRHHQQRRRQGHAAQLLALGPAGAAEAPNQRPGTDRHGQGGEGQGQLVDDQQHPTQAVELEGATDHLDGGSTGPGASVTATSSSSGTATMALAHQRQPGEGSFPVGVNSA
jgi:hypothetical protein